MASRLVRTNAVTVGDVLDGHTLLEIDCWDAALPPDAVLYPEDYPAAPQAGSALPRHVAEQVMQQVEDEARLARWDNPAYRLITLILVQCGLRISSALTLAFDCVARDSQGAPYLRYYNTKMKREALVPMDEELAAGIRGQQERVTSQWPAGTPVLFPRPLRNITGRHTMTSGTYRDALYRWLERCDIRDEHGEPVHLTPHQWRHTLGTRLKVSRIASDASFGSLREHALPAVQHAA